ncbi:hypothetical protein [Streptomyces sp. 11x1]|uniref:hypothetical protein n=1 Tax=Streptomyces sp. 11x1 TaxID=3038642 RepID=UPI00292F99F7|nr:hypothetical protein [Streptomyces sp. 11x1]WNZ14845.1 hypothetical protein P8T65_03465 [Streptomyces sp. 11x1]
MTPIDNPDAPILQHYPQVAQGERTAVVGHYVPGDFRLCTLTRHHEGQIVEEGTGLARVETRLELGHHLWVLTEESRQGSQAAAAEERADLSE